MAQSLTVVVASYQRAQHLATLLDSLAAALADPCGCDVDVLVLLDGSTDGSSAQLDALQPDFPVPLRYEW